MRALDSLNLNEKKIIIFDMDGTLIDSIGVWNITDQKLIEILGKQKIELDIIQQERDRFLEQHQKEDIYLAYCGYLKQKYHFSMNEKEILALRWSISESYLKEQVDYKKQAEIVLKELKKREKILALATVTTQRQLDIYEHINPHIRGKARLSKTFDVILSKENLTHKKPHPEIYQKIQEYFQVTKKECMVFEDSYLGVLAAKNAGIEVINVYDRYADLDRGKIEAIADYKITHYDEFLNYLENLYKR
ncbi:MAG: HAD family hydrolase [Beduini sp.]|uniref:HAD family hydrolase n=1 Tax=Beduini sp. TaxID=1922300 RepID=UPI0011C8FBC6